MSDLEESDEENYEENNYVERYEIDREDLENYIAAFLDEATLEYLQRLKLTVNAPPDAPIDEAALMDRPTATGSTFDVCSCGCKRRDVHANSAACGRQRECGAHI
jgi:hypothetical protein